MNILVGINDRYADALIVMLTSLFSHNRVQAVYCLYFCLSKENQERLAACAAHHGVTMHFLCADVSKYAAFPVTRDLTVECYLLLLAHQLLPQDMERILYLDCDIIVDGSLEDLYATAFEGNYLAACGQYYKEIDGHPWRKGARPEEGAFFNSGVILFNLPLMRRDITAQTYMDAAKQNRYTFELADQGLLNIVFWEKTKYLDTMRWNFRLNMYEDFVRDGHIELSDPPVIYHYVMHDYYQIGQGTKPWSILLDAHDVDALSYAGIMKRTYGDGPVVQMNLRMQHLWWKYAAKCEYFETLRTTMLANKERFYQQRMDGHRTEILAYRKRQTDFEKISQGEAMPELLEHRYRELEPYIDSLAPDDAIQTMKYIHQAAADRLKNKARIKVAFMVYSSSEWQCERLYRLMEADARFEPTIFICGYDHGNVTQIQRTYRSTCRYFFESEKTYAIEYGGCTWTYQREIIEDFDLLVYITPYNDALLHAAYNLKNRKLRQLVLYITYGVNLIARDEAYYGREFGYGNLMVFKFAWMVTESSKQQIAYDRAIERLKAYNVIVSGSPKMDEIRHLSIRKDLWKMPGKCVAKIIWAPHFNMQKGMMGTFDKNYKWFYEFAQKHPEISWIVRPHPRMSRGALDAGVFQNQEQYEEYLRKWNQLPNAKVLEFGDYLDAFVSSDAMILDSISFVAEYQFTGHPLLFLCADVPRMMAPFGQSVFSHVYQCRGDDFTRIASFVDDVSRGRDPMKQERQEFFDEALNYMKWNHKEASRYVFDCIVKRLT